MVPGFVHDTEFGRFPDISRVTIQAASGPYASTVADYFRWVTDEGWGGAAQSRWEVADVVVETIVSPAPAFRIPTSALVRDYLDHKLADLDGADIQTLARGWISGRCHVGLLHCATADRRDRIVDERVDDRDDDERQ